MENAHQHDNHEGGERPPHAPEAPPRPATPEDPCPVCLGDTNGAAPCCQNGHVVCDICLPQLLRMPYGAGHRCPMCRQPITRRPEGHAAAGGGAAPVHPHHDHRYVGGHDAIGRVGGGRPHNGPVWEEARRRFLENRDQGRIPGNAFFGGIHERKCGHRGCERHGGSQGVRFLLYGDTGKRRYRCEDHTQG